jgi:hypothetical protein
MKLARRQRIGNLLERAFVAAGLECLEQLRGTYTSWAALPPAPCIDFAPQRIPEVGQLVVAPIDAGLG